MTLDDPAFTIFKSCEELGAAVFIHPWDSALRWLADSARAHGVGY